ncbi:MotE family protein [Sediminicoccus sp. BL-A-41-H5]|uniref:MotE family protein n=1 Tax=Sediminicoccus sp. BL-A-41-H5 TaxID=3421106 RepID=UPI003D673A3B
MRWPTPRLLPVALLGMAALAGVKLEALLRGGEAPGIVTSAVAQAPTAPPAATPPAAAAAAPQATPPAGSPATPPAASPAAAPAAPPPAPDQAAERAVLEALRARRAEIEAREAALAQREMLMAAAERRLADRLEELNGLRQRLEAEGRQRDERTEQGWRQMVRLYEGMRPRDAAGIFDELEMPVLLQVVDRMREAKAAPVLAAMRPERARALTTELARHRSRPLE